MQHFPTTFLFIFSFLIKLHHENWMTTERYIKTYVHEIDFISHNMYHPPRILSILITDLRRSGFRHRSFTFFTRRPSIAGCSVSKCTARLSRSPRVRHAEVQHCIIVSLSLSLSFSNPVLGQRERDAARFGGSGDGRADLGQSTI